MTSLGKQLREIASYMRLDVLRGNPPQEVDVGAYRIPDDWEPFPAYEEEGDSWRNLYYGDGDLSACVYKTTKPNRVFGAHHHKHQAETLIPIDDCIEVFLASPGAPGEPISGVERAHICEGSMLTIPPGVAHKVLIPRPCTIHVFWRPGFAGKSWSASSFKKFPQELPSKEKSVDPKACNPPLLGKFSW